MILYCLMFLAAVSAQAKTILLIESYHAEFAWDVSYKAAIKEVLGPKHSLVTFQMDTKRLPKDKHLEMADKAWQEYKKVKPDLVITGDDAALKLLGPRFATTETPVVYLGVNRNPRDYHMIGVKNITGILERPLMKRSIAFLIDIIVPNPKKILVLFDSDISSQASLEQEFNGTNKQTITGVDVEVKLIAKFDEWQKTVLNAKKNGYDALIIGLYQTLTDAHGANVADKKVLTWTSENTPVPPFAFWDFPVGADKAIGGYVLFGKTQGEEAAKMSLEILGGKPPSQIIPKTSEQGRFLFSRSQLKKWNIKLPTDIGTKADYVE